MSHQLVGFEVAVADMLEESRPLPLDRALVHVEGEPLVERVAELHRAEHRPVGADHRHGAALANRVDRPVESDRRAALQLELGRGDVHEEVAVRLRADRVDRHVGAEVVGGLLHLDDDVVVVVVVERLGVGELPGLLQPVVELVDDDHPARAHQPGRLRGVQPDGAGAEDDDGVTLGDVADGSAEVAGGDRIGQEDGVLLVHPVRDDARADVGERHPDVLRLAAVVAAAGVGVAVDAADGGRVGVDVVAVGVQAACAEVAVAAEHVERHHHPGRSRRWPPSSPG